jgi:hypothetical protein
MQTVSSAARRIVLRQDTGFDIVLMGRMRELEGSFMP